MSTTGLSHLLFFFHLFSSFWRRAVKREWHTILLSEIDFSMSRTGHHKVRKRRRGVHRRRAIHLPGETVGKDRDEKEDDLWFGG